MKNEVSKKCSVEETTNLNTNANNQDYSTFVEKSMEYNPDTTQFDLYKGFLYMFLSCFFKSIFSILCKIELDRNNNMTSFHLLTFKAYFMLCITVIVGLYYLVVKLKEKVDSPKTNIYEFSRSNFNFIMLRGILSVFSISLTIFSLKYLSISQVYSVFYVYPGIVILMSYFILNEKVGMFDYVCLISCFIGVLLVIRPDVIIPQEGNSFNKNQFVFFLLVIIGAFLKACEDIIIRNVGTEIHCVIVPSIYSIVGVVFYPVTLGFLVENIKFIPDMDSIDLLLIIFISLFSFVYQTLMCLAIQSENAGRVAMINYFQVFFMFISDLFIFQRKMIFLDVIGTFLIFSFNLINGVRKALKRSDQLIQYKTKNNINFTPKDV